MDEKEKEQKDKRLVKRKRKKEVVGREIKEKRKSRKRGGR